MESVLITDDVHPILIAGLDEMGYDCDYQPDISPDQTADVIRNYDGMVINSKIKATQTLMEKAPKLKWIARLGSGLEIIDLLAAEQKDITVFSAPEGNCNAVAEHAMGMLLSLTNKIHTGNGQVRDFNWQREANRGMELQDRKIGIIGYGHAGPAFAHKLAGFGVEVLVYDRFKEDIVETKDYIRVCDLATIQEEADVISLHVSLNPSSHLLLNEDFIQACAKPFILVNTSRGQVVCTEDLISALDQGKITGACLDVYENEKPDSYTDYEKKLYSTLYKLDNVVLTPHVAGWTIESKEKIAKTLLSKIGAINR